MLTTSLCSSSQAPPERVMALMTLVVIVLLSKSRVWVAGVMIHSFFPMTTTTTADLQELECKPPPWHTKRSQSRKHSLPLLSHMTTVLIRQS